MLNQTHPHLYPNYPEHTLFPQPAEVSHDDTATALANSIACRLQSFHSPENPSPSQTINHVRTLEQVSASLKEGFAAFQEVWIVGHKGDHANTLQALGILKKDLDLIHVHSTLGVSARHTITPPPGSSDTYDGFLKELNEADMRPHIRRIIAEQKKVVILMPFPNSALSRIVEEEQAGDWITLATTMSNVDTYFHIDDKIRFASMMDDVLGKDYPENIIPWTVASVSSLREHQTRLRIEPDRAIYFQKTFSGGGDGTVKISSEEQFQVLLQQKGWREAVIQGQVKAGAAVLGKRLENGELLPPYPANGSACIVPTADGKCRVYIDPPSHKPVGLAHLGSKPAGGVGNDWSQPFDREIQEQYKRIVTRLGEYLFYRFGYTGMFGPDCLVGVTPDNTPVLHVNELNPRWQGTTPYQTLNSLRNQRLPLELMHYLVKLRASNRDDLANVEKLLPDVTDYNQEAVNSSGGFYIKVGTKPDKSGKKRTVQRDMNGIWFWTGSALKRADELGTSLPDGLNVVQVYLRQDTHGNPLTLPSGAETVVWVKAPRKGETVGGELAPIGYIVGSNINVFDAHKPDVTPTGQRLYDAVMQLLFQEPETEV